MDDAVPVALLFGQQSSDLRGCRRVSYCAGDARHFRCGTNGSQGSPDSKQEALKQIHADGVPAEQSPSYGAYSTELLLLCNETACAAGRPLADGLMQRLSCFADFIFWLSDENGHPPQIGDDDEGHALAFDHQPWRYAASIAASIGTPHRRYGTRTFAEGGYTVIREHRAGHDLHIVFDHGPLGYLAIAAHGHADALSVVVTLDGKPLFVDPGTYLFHSGGAWRDWFRSTPAHNTLNIAGQSQSVISGPFNWSTKANTELHEASAGKHWSFSASHEAMSAVTA